MMAYKKKHKKNETWYRPDQKTRDRRGEVYGYVDTMVERRNQTYPEFNDDGGNQTLRQYVDDSDRRLNGYTLNREAQGKDPWQANIFNPITRAKLRAIVAGVSTTFPEFTYKATKGGLRSPQRSELVKQMVNYSRQKDNPRLTMFWEAWEASGKGTVITYDGYRHVVEETDVITSYDAVTGEVETETEEVVTESRAIDEIVPITEFFIWDFYIHNVQDQPRVAWVDYLEEDGLKKEYGNFKNYKYLRDGKTLSASRYEGDTESYYYKRWSSRVGSNDNKFERVRYYSKADNCYEVWINGVLMQKTPLLWGGKKSKVYPFAKTIYEPFSNKQFFYGMSLPKLLQSFQDVDNMTWDMILDLAFRSLNPRMLAGLANKDLLDIEDELMSEDDVQYVPDVTQVRPYPVRGIQGGDIQLLNMIRQAMDFVSVDPTQQGVGSGSGKTPQEIMVLNERAQELKGIFYSMLEDLWLQKTRLRIPNVLLNYMRPQNDAILGETGGQTITGAMAEYEIDDAMMSDGSRGVLGVAVFPDKESLPRVSDVQAKEEAMTEQGMIYKQIAVTSDYLDEWEYEWTLVPQTLENASISTAVAKITQKQQGMVELYPEYIASNKEKMFAEYIEPYGETLEDYQPPAAEPPSELEQLMSSGESLTGNKPPKQP